jgi:hypothetical protein
MEIPFTDDCSRHDSAYTLDNDPCPKPQNSHQDDQNVRIRAYVPYPRILAANDEMLAEIQVEGRYADSRMAVVSYQQQSQDKSQVRDRDECEYHEKSWRKHENGRMIQQESGRHLQSESVS